MNIYQFFFFIFILGYTQITKHVKNSAAGIKVIRASAMEREMKAEFHRYSDDQTQAYYASICAQNWFGVRIDLIVTLYSICLVFGCIFLKSKKRNLFVY
jgi:hypothetical protein